MGIIADLEDSPRGVYCGAVGYLAPASAGPAERVLQRGDQDRGGRRRERDRRVRRGRRHHVGLVGGRRVRRDRREGQGAHRPTSAVRVARVDAARSRRADPPRSSSTSNVSGAPPRTSGSRSTRQPYARRWTRPASVPTVRSRSGCDSRGSGRSRSRGGARSRRPEPVRLALDDVAGGSGRRLPVPQDHDAPARTRTRAPAIPTPTTRSSSTRAGRSPRRRSRTSPRSSTDAGGRLRSTQGCCPGPNARRSRGRHVGRAGDLHRRGCGPRKISPCSARCAAGDAPCCVG